MYVAALGRAIGMVDAAFLDFESVCDTARLLKFGNKACLYHLD